MPEAPLGWAEPAPLARSRALGSYGMQDGRYTALTGVQRTRYIWDVFSLRFSMYIMLRMGCIFSMYILICTYVTGCTYMNWR